jgi:demethylmenaquinone methyltransferase/2-methoxy-6-polyprenyl-1,4-benzoquinol methylase
MVLDLAFGRKLYDWFGAHASVYRAVRWISCLGREQSLQRLAIAAIGLKQGDAVLDLACGAGVNLPYLRERVGPEGKILALDYSEGMLAVARETAEKHGWTNVEFAQADATQMELEANSLDGAICTFGLSAMPGELAALQRVAKAMKPGARFVAFDAKPFTGWGRIINPINQPLFKYATNWNYSKDVLASLHTVFDAVEVEEHNSGCNYIAVARKL